MFVGRKKARDHEFGLSMLGHYIVISVVRQLIQDFKINTKHTKVRYHALSFLIIADKPLVHAASLL